MSSAGSVLCIIKEASSLLQDQLQLHELTVTLLQALTVAVDLCQLCLQLIQLSLQVDHQAFLTENFSTHSMNGMPQIDILR